MNKQGNPDYSMGVPQTGNTAYDGFQEVNAYSDISQTNSVQNKEMDLLSKPILVSGGSDSLQSYNIDLFQGEEVKASTNQNLLATSQDSAMVD